MNREQRIPDPGQDDESQESVVEWNYLRSLQTAENAADAQAARLKRLATLKQLLAQIKWDVTKTKEVVSSYISQLTEVLEHICHTRYIQVTIETRPAAGNVPSTHIFLDNPQGKLCNFCSIVVENENSTIGQRRLDIRFARQPASGQLRIPANSYTLHEVAEMFLETTAQTEHEQLHMEFLLQQRNYYEKIPKGHEQQFVQEYLKFLKDEFEELCIQLYQCRVNNIDISYSDTF